MLKTKKIMLKPTEAQEVLFWKSAGAARWAYNYHLSRNNENYSEGGKYLTGETIRKEITQLKKQEEYEWLKEVGSNVIKQAVKDCDKAFKDFFEKKKGYPNYKTRRKSRPSFYVNYESLQKTSKGFRGEKLGGGGSKNKGAYARDTERCSLCESTCFFRREILVFNSRL